MSDDLEDIKRTQEAIDARLDALSTKLDELTSVVCGDRALGHADIEETPPVIDQLNSVQQDLDELNRQTKAAIASEETRSDGGEVTKKALAKRKARNKLVTNLVGTSATESKVKYTTIQSEIDQAEIHYQTVKSAAKSLAHEWQAFGTVKDESGAWCLVIDADHLEKELVYLVEEDLARDDLTKRLISKNSSGGVSA